MTATVVCVLPATCGSYGGCILVVLSIQGVSALGAGLSMQGVTRALGVHGCTLGRHPSEFCLQQGAAVRVSGPCESLGSCVPKLRPPLPWGSTGGALGSTS